MEVDTGSAVSIVSEVEYKKWFKHLKLQLTQFHSNTYFGESLPLLCTVLLGRNWLEKLSLDWPTIFQVSHVPALEDILAKYEALFETGYGHIKLSKAPIRVREGAEPLFLKARPVPYALKERWSRSFRDWRMKKVEVTGLPQWCCSPRKMVH